jgi:hypothetical protein
MAIDPREEYRARAGGGYELENPLHRYATYNALFTLSGLTELEIRNPERYLTGKVHDIIARSSGIGAGSNAGISDATAFSQNQTNALAAAGITGPQADRIVARYEYETKDERYMESADILRRNHDIFFENVNILSTIGPNSERNLANFTKMEFQLHEPHSITFIEKVRAATFLNGFRDYQDAPLLLTIEFRGYDENGRPLATGMRETRKIPILIVRVDFDVNEGGAKYNITAVPYGDMAFDDRFKVLRTRLEPVTNTFDKWKESMEKRLAEQMDNEIKEKVRQFADTYRFEVEDGLLISPLKASFELKSQYGTSTVEEAITLKLVQEQGGINPREFGLGDYTQTVKSDKTQTVDSGTTVSKALEDFIKSEPGFYDLTTDFWRAYLTLAGYKLDEDKIRRDEFIRNFLKDEKNATEIREMLLKHNNIPWFKIKTSVYTDTSRLDNITKMHPKEIVYKAIKYNIPVLKFLATGLSVGKVDWAKYVRKNYDYIYTGDNVDVQGLRINYKSAYYMRNVRGDDKTENETALEKAVRTSINLVRGEEDYPEPLLPLRNYPSNIKGRSSSTSFRPGGNKSQEFFDYLTNPEADMMRIELDILGDPHYLCQDVFANLKRINDKKTELVVGRVDDDFDQNQFGSFNADKYMPIINLRYRLPDDIDEREGTMFSGKNKYRQENLFFNGVYQVVKVDSRFDNGQFLQTLTCVRLNNQQGQGLPPSLLTTAFNNKYLNDVEDTRSNAQKKGTLASEKWKNMGDGIGRINPSEKVKDNLSTRAGVSVDEEI